MTAEADRRYMSLAIALGARGLGQVWPNPAVGCVLVRDGRIVGRGWTQEGGRPHAETIALAQAGAAARGATAYVSLEPCAHHGKTPPCADALINAGVARVVTAAEDPDARVAGRGHQRLQDAGIAVDGGVLQAQAEHLQAGFLRRVRTGMPLMTLKLASSLDGRIATAGGESQWITGPAARRRVHQMRATHDAILIGAGTARADDPTLSVRGLGKLRQPVRLVVSAHLDLPLAGNLARTAREQPLWLLHGPDAPAARREQWVQVGARPIEVAARNGQVDLRAAAHRLGAEGLTRVFCEGGGQLAAGLMAAGLVDRLAVFSAGVAIGQDGLPSVGPLGVAQLADAPRFALAECLAVGADVLSFWERTDRA